MTTPTPPARPAAPPPTPATTPTTPPAASKTPIPIGPILLGGLLALAALILWSADRLGWLTTGIIAAVLALLTLAAWLAWRARKRSGRPGGGSSSRSPLARLRSALPRALGGTRGTTTGGSSRPGILGRMRAGLPGRLGGTRGRSTGGPGSGSIGGRSGGSRTGTGSVFGPSGNSRRPTPTGRNTSSNTGSKTSGGNGSSGTGRPSNRPTSPTSPTPPSNNPPDREPIGFTRRTPAPAAPEGGSPMAAANDGSEMGLIAWNRRVKQAAGPLGDMAGFIGRLATESERQPVPQSVTDELRALASQQKRISERVAEIHGNVRKTNETDYARAETPRRGSISVEAKADVTRSTREG